MSHRWACILGRPVRYSLSPALHNAAFAALGLDAHYEAREVEDADVPHAVAALRDPACLGANVTAPHKQAVIPLLESLSPEARLLGAVNTILHRDSQLTGDNTDAAGLARWMEDVGIAAAVRGGTALVLGAGGAARATVLALDRCGVRAAQVLNRSQARAETLVADLQPHQKDLHLTAGNLDLASAPATEPAAIVVNATSLGHHGGAPVVHPTWYTPASVALELVYNPPETAFMTAARAAGAGRVENGLGMLIYQAVLAFERWTGQTPPVAVYEAAAAKALGGRA